MQKQIIILGAGKGSRMKSDLPKVMHKVGGKSMLERVVDNALAVTDNIILVYSDHIKEYLPLFENKCKLVYQEEQLGTAHAVWVARSFIRDDINTAVLYGDNPLITPEIIIELFDHLDAATAAVDALVFEHEEPNAYGRIILDDKGDFKKIVEFKFASEEERKIKLCNSGIMAFAPGILNKYLPACIDQAKNSLHGKELYNSDNLRVGRKTSGELAERTQVREHKRIPKFDAPNLEIAELYLTEIIEVCSNQGEKVVCYTSKNHQQVIGVNTQEELLAANRIFNNKTTNE